MKSVRSKSITNYIEAYAWFNNSTHICYEASRSCVNGAVSANYDDQLKHISNRVKVGHESVIEHSNFVVAMTIPDKYLPDLVEVLAANQYLYAKTKRCCAAYTIIKWKSPHISFSFKSEIESDSNCTLVNIAGSIRGWKHIYRNITNIDSNRVLMQITKLIYLYIPKEYFVDLIQDNIMKESSFYYHNEEFSTPDISNDFVSLINIDTKTQLFNDIPSSWIIDDSGHEIDNMLTITIDFINMARYSTHQLVRHRNAITQSSQRYINFSKANGIAESEDPKTNNPMIYNKDYDTVYKNKPYNIEFGTFNGTMTTDELLAALAHIYTQLKDQGMTNENARAFGPQAMAAGHVYMTFTISHLLQFLNLRMDPHAQAEIRTFADKLYDELIKIDELHSYLEKDSSNKFIGLLPTYALINIKKEKMSDYEEEELSEKISEPVDKEFVYFKDDPDSDEVQKIKNDDIPIESSKSEDV